MSQANENHSAQYDPVLSDLDKALAEMSLDAPMPGDFHSKWTSAVRDEARKNERSFKTARWRTFLSIAAVFAFLIGGTFVYRFHGTIGGQPLSLTNVPISREKMIDDTILLTGGNENDKGEPGASAGVTGTDTTGKKQTNESPGRESNTPEADAEKSPIAQPGGFFPTLSAFLKDLWGFVTFIWPYLLIPAGILVIWMVKRKRKK